MNNLKIAIDSGPLTGGDSVRGKGVYVQELLKALKMDGVDVSRADLSNYDVVHFTSFNPFFVSIPFSKPSHTKFVLTIYDLIPLIYPKHYPPGVRGWLKWQINKYLIKKNIDAIITISETSKKDICRFIGFMPSKVFVTYLAPLTDYKKLENISGENFPNRFVFNYGDINYNKNIPNLVIACEKLHIPLVIGGKQGKELAGMDMDHPEHRHLKSVYDTLLDRKKVIRPGYISDVEANMVYNLALVYVQPSFYEGFGLSVVNAFAAGCPVVAARTQALVEIGEDACLYVDPHDPADIAEKIKLVLDNPKIRKEMIEKGFDRVKKFSWQKTAKETMEVYSNV